MFNNTWLEDTLPGFFILSLEKPVLSNGGYSFLLNETTGTFDGIPTHNWLL